MPVVAASRRVHVFGSNVYLMQCVSDAIDLISLTPIARSMEGTMSNHELVNRAPTSQRVVSGLHPAVYMALVGLTFWLILAIWGFGYDGQTDYLLAIVSGFLSSRSRSRQCWH
jgi:hypothetical protein